MKPEALSKSGSEFGEQSALFCWANSKATRERFPHLFNPKTKRCKMYANYNNAGSTGGPDSGKTNAIRGMRAKQTGMQSGVADVFLPLARHGCHGLYIELKINPAHPANKGKKGKVSDDQKAFGAQVQEDGYGWAVAEGWQEAASIIEKYLS